MVKRTIFFKRKLVTRKERERREGKREREERGKREREERGERE